MELLLVRHALPVRRELATGPADPELSEVGVQQARHLADYLSTERLDAVYTSPLLRAHQTAEPVALAQGRPVTVVDGVASHGGERIAVVCHGGVIAAYLTHVLGLPDPNGFFYPNYTSIHRVAAARTGERTIVTLNETAHLRRTGLPMGLFQGATS